MTERRHHAVEISGGNAPAGDDTVLPFRTDRSGAEGRVVRLGKVAEEILEGHAYPEPVSRLLGEALALAAMLGSPLKDGGRLSLETRSDGAVRSLVVNVEVPGRLRGYAGFDATAVAEGVAKAQPLLGAGHLALTIEPGEGEESYQGIAAIDGGSLVDAARDYFRQSEQLPTFIRLAAARAYINDGDGKARWTWRVGGLMLQHFTATGLDQPGDLPAGEGLDDELSEGELPARDPRRIEEDWRRARMLAETVEAHELVDPALSPEQLLYRLFHEEGVRVRATLPLATFCRCSRERIATFLARFSDAQLDELRQDDGAVVVTCEFCGRQYRFE